ncbi:MAG: sigma-70 family RNA polymerase sigma factor [Acidobacteria bacterium]|nr:MAG: sigma-70 family RNA polymerase sigma factor [Acidobacteriota bacterium]
MPRQRGDGEIPGEERDCDLIRAYLVGDRDALDLVERWTRQELLAHRRPPGLELSELNQSVHCRLLGSLRSERFLRQCSLRTYVSRIARYTLLEHLRRPDGLCSPAAISDLWSHDDPAEEIGRAEMQTVLRRALEQVPPGCRKLWHYALVDELTCAEIARRLDIPTGTVKSRMWYCRRRLRCALRRLGVRREDLPLYRRPG